MEKLQLQRSALQATFTLGGWGGEAEKSYRETVSRAASQTTLLWATFRVISFFTAACFLELSNPSENFGWDIAATFRANLPTFVLLAGFFRNDLLEWGTWAQVSRLLNKLIIALGLWPRIGAFKKLSKSCADVGMELLYFPLIEQVPVMPWALVTRILAVPIYKYHSGQSLFRWTVVHGVALVIHIFIELHQRHKFYRRVMRSRATIPPVSLPAGGSTDDTNPYASSSQYSELLSGALHSEQQVQQELQELQKLHGQQKQQVQQELPEQQELQELHGQQEQQAQQEQQVQQKQLEQWGHQGLQEQQEQQGQHGLKEQQEQQKPALSTLPPPHEEHFVYGIDLTSSDSGDLVFDGLEDYISYVDEEEVEDEGDLGDSDRPPIDDVIANIKQGLAHAAGTSAWDDILDQRAMVHVYVPWADPRDLKPNTEDRFRKMLQELVPGTKISIAAVRKGSLIVSLELICDLGNLSASLPDLLRSMVSPSSWLECLDLPWPKDGEDVTVQVGDKSAFSINWQNGIFEVLAVSLPASITVSEICSLSPPTFTLGKVQFQTGEVEVQVTSTGTLVSAAEATSPDCSVLRARYMGMALPVTLKHLPEPEGCEELTHMSATVKLPVDALTGHEELQNGVIILEVWKNRLVTQSVPIIMLQESRQDMCWELAKAIEESNMVVLMKGTKDKWSAGIQPMVFRLGYWLQIVNHLKHEQDSLAEVDAYMAISDGNLGKDEGAAAEVSWRALLEERERRRAHHLVSMSYASKEGYKLLEMSVTSGWIHIGTAVLNELMSLQGCGWVDVAHGNNKTGDTLLHLAVVSGKRYMVAAVIEWGRQYGVEWVWSVTNSLGATPLHVLACTGDTDLAKSVLKKFPSARHAWGKSKGGVNCTPAQLAARNAMDLREAQNARRSLSSGPSRFTTGAPCTLVGKRSIRTAGDSDGGACRDNTTTAGCFERVACRDNNTTSGASKEAVCRGILSTGGVMEESAKERRSCSAALSSVVPGEITCGPLVHKTLFNSAHSMRQDRSIHSSAKDGKGEGSTSLVHAGDVKVAEHPLGYSMHICMDPVLQLASLSEGLVLRCSKSSPKDWESMSTLPRVQSEGQVSQAKIEAKLSEALPKACESPSATLQSRFWSKIKHATVRVLDRKRQ